MKAVDLFLPSKQGAGCLFFAPQNKKFLLLKRSTLVTMPNYWCLPGGGVEPYETPAEAVKREIYEETGFDLTLPLHLIYTNETHAPRFRFYNYAVIVEKPFKPVLNWENSEYGWFDIGELPQPLHWGLEQLFQSDRAAKILHNIANKDVVKTKSNNTL